MEVMSTGQAIPVGSEEAIQLSPQTIQRRHYLVLAQKHGFRPPPAPVFSATVTPSLPPGFKKASGDGSILMMDDHRFAQVLEAHRKAGTSVTQPNP
jgi:hypothetical protein